MKAAEYTATLRCGHTNYYNTIVATYDIVLCLSCDGYRAVQDVVHRNQSPDFQRKTTCPKDHPRNDVNGYYVTRGDRSGVSWRCRICEAENKRKRYQAAREDPEKYAQYLARRRKCQSKYRKSIGR